MAHTQVEQAQALKILRQLITRAAILKMVLLTEPTMKKSPILNQGGEAEQRLSQGLLHLLLRSSTPAPPHLRDQSRESSVAVLNSRRRRHSFMEDMVPDDDRPPKRRRTNTASSDGSDEEIPHLSRAELLQRVLPPNQRLQSRAVRQNRQPLSPRGHQAHTVEVRNSHESFDSTRAANESFTFPVIDMTEEAIRPAVNHPGMKVFGEPALQNFNTGSRLASGHQTLVPPTRRPNANQLHRRRTPLPARSASLVLSESLPAYEDLSPPPPAYRPIPAPMPAFRLRLNSPRPVPRLNLRLGPSPQHLQQNPSSSVEQNARAFTSTATDRQDSLNRTPIRRSHRIAQQKRR